MLFGFSCTAVVSLVLYVIYSIAIRSADSEARARELADRKGWRLMHCEHAGVATCIFVDALDQKQSALCNRKVCAVE